MFCINCGFKLDDNAKFCVSCGAAQPLIHVKPATVVSQTVAPSEAAQSAPVQPDLPQQDFTQPYQPDHSYAPQPVKKAGKGKIILIILLIVLLIGAGIGVAVFAVTGGFSKEPSLVTAAQYLEDDDLDSAIAEYEALLENDPQNAEAYIGLAEAYLSDGKEKKAIKTLEDALEILESKDDIRDIAELLSEYATEPAFTTPISTSQSVPDTSEPDIALFDINTITGEWYCEEVFFGNDLKPLPINLVIDSDTLTLTSADDIISIAPEQYTEYGFTLNYLDHSFEFAYNDHFDTIHMFIVDADLTTSYSANFRRGQIDITATNRDTGKVLNIWSYNDEFKLLFEEYYAVYQDDYIGDVRVEWHIIPAYDDQYQNELDMALLNGDNLAEDEQVDLFLIEPDYSHKYVDSPFTMPIYEIGLTEEDTAQMYPYTIQIGTDHQGVLKAVSWQATPGVFVYRRSIAKAVLGTDDPAAVQGYVADWNSFTQTAEQMKAQGYCMLSGPNDAQRVFTQNRSEGWVNDNNELVISDELIIWLTQTKMFADNGYDNDHKLWTENWIKDMSAEGNVFGFFLPTWHVNWILPMNSADSYGDWAVCNGPAAYNWGSAYLCAAYDTDNTELIRDIMYQLTCNEEIMYQIGTAPESLDYTNNMSAMARAAEDPANASEFLGGQNPFSVFHENAMAIDFSNATLYDLALNELLAANFEPYFNNLLSFEDALNNFINAAITNYPELIYISDDTPQAKEDIPVTE